MRFTVPPRYGASDGPDPCGSPPARGRLCPPTDPPDARLRLTVILDSLGKPPLQSLVHGLQPRRDILVSDRRLVRAHQLLQG